MSYRGSSISGRHIAYCGRWRCWFCLTELMYEGAPCDNCHAHNGGQSSIPYPCRCEKRS